MTGPEAESHEGYGAFAWAYDAALGQSYFAAIAPLLSSLTDRYQPPDRNHLDLACGTGLAMEHFRAIGFLSRGVDASVPMLSVAKSRVGGLIGGDLRSLPLRGSFGLVTCLYDSLNHLLLAEDLQAAFGQAAGLMSSESLFIFDLNHPQAYAQVWALEEPFVSEGRTHRLQLDTTYSRKTRMAHADVLGWAEIGGRRVRISEQRHQRAYSRREVLKLLRKAGLKALEVIDFDPFREIRPGGEITHVKMVFVARRA